MALDDTTLRVLTVTRNHSLVVGMTFLGRPWRVTAHAEPQDADASRADVVVVDLGTTQAAVEALACFTERPPAVVIGTDPVAMAAEDRFIPRPFTLDDLATSIDAVVAGNVDTRESAGESGFWVLPGWALDDLEDEVAAAPDATPTVIDLAALERQDGERKDQTVVPASHGREHAADRPRVDALARLRSMATRKRASVPIDPSLQRDEALRRFAQGVTAGGELETLLADMPILRSVRTLGAAIVEEVHTELEADTTAYWQRFDDGFRVLASQGLTKVEQHLVVALVQPMLGEIHTTGGGLLIDPVDAVQAAVAGIGGARTESFMAAAIAIGEGRYGILAVGRNRPLVPDDLDRLIAVATEAAPGIALAQLLRRVTGQVVLPAVHREQDVFADERTQKESRFGHADA